MARMKHPDSAQTIEVSPSQVALYESQGWVKKAARKAARKAVRKAAPIPATTAKSKE